MSEPDEASTVALPAGWRLAERASVDSTNLEASRAAEAGAAGGLVVFAHEQLAGRGRQGRGWASPRGNLYCSVLLRPDALVRDGAQLSFVAALAVHDTVAGLLGKPARAGCKWPNDVLVGGAKIAGILLESRGRPDGRLDWVIVGTGINVAHAPRDTERPATSLSAEGVDVAVARVLERYLTALDEWVNIWLRDGFDPVRAAWLDRALSLGRTIRARWGRREVVGRFETLDAGGALVLRTEDGALTRVGAGEIFEAS